MLKRIILKTSLLVLKCFFFTIIQPNNEISQEQQAEAQSFQNKFKSISKANPSNDSGIEKDFGQAFLRRIDNGTSFNIELVSSSTTNQIIPDNSTVRIKINSDAYGSKKPFMALSSERINSQSSATINLFRADCFDGQDPRCHFSIANYVDDNKQNWLGFSPIKEQNKKIQANKNSEDIFLVTLEKDELRNSSGNAQQWQLIGSLEKCYLKNNLTKGFMGPSEQVGLDGYQSSTNNIKYFDYKQNNTINIDSPTASKTLLDLERYSIQKNMRFNYWFITKAIENIAESATKGMALTKSLQEKMSKEFDNCRNAAELVTCAYGDLIRIKSFSAYQNLRTDDNNEQVFCSNADFNESSQNDVFLFKGEHSENDRWNCSVGQRINPSKPIRIEHILSGKNLTVSTKEITNENFAPETVKSHKRFELSLNGNLGIGSIADNWIMIMLDGDTDVYTGSRFMLLNPSSNCWLSAEMIFKSKDKTTRQLTTGLLKVEKSMEEQKKDAYAASFTSSADLLEQGTSAKELSLDDKPTPKKNTSANVTETDPFLTEKTWFIDSIQKNELSEKDLIRTGYKNGAAFDRIGTTIPNNQELSIETISLGGKTLLAPKTDFWFDELGNSKGLDLIKESLELSGSFSQDIASLLPGTSLKIAPLLNSGIVWITKSLLEKNKFACQFLAKVSDSGDLSIVLGNELSKSFIYKIYLGKASNSQSAITKIDSTGQEKELITIYNDQQKIAKIPPGLVIPIWIVFNNGLFLIGQNSSLGTNIFLAYQDQDFSQSISRIGFSCGQSSIFLSSLNITPIIEPKKPTRTYEKITDFSKGNNNKGFRISGEFCFSFLCEKTNQETIIIKNKNKSLNEEGYKIKINFIDSSLIIWKKENAKQWQKIFETKLENLYKNRNLKKSFWVSYKQGLFFFGMDNIPGEQWLCTFTDNDFIPDINDYEIDDESSISSITSFSPINFFIDRNADEKILKEDSLNIQLKGIFPFRYSIWQEDDQLIIKELISKKSFFVASMPQKGSDYTMMLKINEKGIPSARWLWQPENTNLLEKKWQMTQLASVAEGLNFAASHIQGSGQQGMLPGSLVSIGVGSASIAPAFEVARLKAEIQFGQKNAADQIAIKNQAANAESDSSDLSGQKKLKDSISTNNPFTVGTEQINKANRYFVETKLEELQKFSPSTVSAFSSMLGKFKEVLLKINHPYIVGTEQIKKQIIDGISDLYNYHKEVFPKEDQANAIQKQAVQIELINLLILFAQNPYIFDVSLNSDNAARIAWISKANILATSDLELTEESVLNLPPLFGEYFWLKKQLPEKGNGYVDFSAEGPGDLLIAIAPNPISYIGTTQSLYEVCIYNKESSSPIGAAIRISCLGTNAATTENEECKINITGSKNYRIALENGKVSLFSKDDEDNLTLEIEFKDPYPNKNESYIGFGTWNTEVTVSSIQVSQKKT